MAEIIKTLVELSGLTCTACEKLISKRLLKIEGVIQVKVSLKDETAQIDGSRKINEYEIKKMLAETQYQVIIVH